MKKLKEVLEGKVVSFPGRFKDIEGEHDPKHFNAWHDEAIGYAKRPNDHVGTVKAYEHYYDHAMTKNVKPLSMDDFHKAMIEKGHIAGKLHGLKKYAGINLKTSSDEE